MKRIVLAVAALVLATASARAQTQFTPQYVCGTSGTGQNLYCPAGTGSNGTAGFPVQMTGTGNIVTTPYMASAAQVGAAINISTATTTQLVAPAAGKTIYVTGMTMMAAATDNVTLEYGTGTNCGSGTTVISGAMPLLTGSGFAQGDGVAPIFPPIPASNALCVVTSANVQLSGWLTAAQF